MPSKKSRQIHSAILAFFMPVVVFASLQGCSALKKVDYETMSNRDIIYYSTGCATEAAEEAAALLADTHKISLVERYHYLEDGTVSWNVSLPHNELSLVLDSEGTLVDLHDRHFSISLYPPQQGFEVSFLTEEENEEFTGYIEHTLQRVLGSYRINYVYGETTENGERVSVHDYALLRQFSMPEVWHTLRVGQNIMIHGYLRLEDAPTSVHPIVIAEITAEGEIIYCTVAGGRLM